MLQILFEISEYRINHKKQGMFWTKVSKKGSILNKINRPILETI